MLRKISNAIVSTAIALPILAPAIFARQQVQGNDFEAVNTYIEGEMARWKLPGMALAIVHDGEIVYLNGYGIAGPDDRPMTPQTPMIVASLSKSFTALAIMQLVENGHVDLDDPAQTYLPWFRVADEEASAQITLRHLLNQNSGIANSSGLETFFSEDSGNDPIRIAVERLAHDDLLYPVGETYEYSNANYQVVHAEVMDN